MNLAILRLRCYVGWWFCECFCSIPFQFLIFLLVFAPFFFVHCSVYYVIQGGEVWDCRVWISNLMGEMGLDSDFYFRSMYQIMDFGSLN